MWMSVKVDRRGGGRGAVWMMEGSGVMKTEEDGIMAGRSSSVFYILYFTIFILYSNNHRIL